jgi:hypothetical protein
MLRAMCDPTTRGTRPSRLILLTLLTSGPAGAALGCASTTTPPTPAVAPSATLTPPTVPDTIKTPAGAEVIARFHARGDQVYACGPGAAGGAAFEWTLKRPDATLTTDNGGAAGTHTAGPTWTSADGSAVVGKKLAQAAAPEATAVPWLLLGAVSTSGAGLFSNVTYVQRVATSGGKAPAGGCGADNAGAETRVPYTADYYFFRGGNP